MNYVVGYMLNPATEEVLMLRKNRPAFQNGKWNGIGGKMDKPGETPQQAQAREFFEEAGVETSPESWEHVATVRGCNDEARPGEDYLIYVFRNMVHEFPAFRSVTSEPVKLWTLADIFRLPVIRTIVDEHLPTLPNARFIVPLCFSHTVKLPVFFESVRQH